MMKNKMLVGAVLVGMMSIGQAFAAANSLQNATITATYNGLASGILGVDSGFDISAPFANVSKLDPIDVNSTEFLTSDYAVAFDFNKAGALTIISNSDTNLSFGSYSFTFDFGSTLSQSISGFTLVDASAIAATPVLSVINDHKISVSFDIDATHTWSPYSGATAQLAFTTPVPEPIAPAMLLAGLGVISLSRRRFSKK